MTSNPHKIDTSIILIEQKKDSLTKESQNVIYIPGYFRIKVKNFTQMNLDNLSAQMNATLIFTVFYGVLDEDSVKKLKSQIIFLFARDEAIKLTKKNNLEIKIKQDKQKQLIQFTIRKNFHLKIESDVFCSPFQIVNLIFTVTVQSVKTDQGTIKINLMDTNNNFNKISYTKEGTFGNYDLAEKLMKAEYTNVRDYEGLHEKSGCWAKVVNFKQKIFKEKQTQQNSGISLLNGQNGEDKNVNQKSKNKDKDKDKDKDKFYNFQYAHFNIPLYKFPCVALVTIFIPLQLLAAINLGVFFQDYSLADRIGSIAALMIAFVALIPTIRAQIPPSPTIVFVEILVYLQTLTSLFALIHSITVRNDKEFILVWYTSGLFVLSAIINIITFIIIVVMVALHQLYWKKKYNQDLDKNNDPKQKLFKRDNWKNPQCDQYFKSRSYQNNIKLLPYQKKNQP